MISDCPTLGSCIPLLQGMGGRGGGDAKIEKKRLPRQGVSDGRKEEKGKKKKVRQRKESACCQTHNLSLISRTHKVEEESQPLKVVLWPSLTSTHTHTTK